MKDKGIRGEQIYNRIVSRYSEVMPLEEAQSLALNEFYRMIARVYDNSDLSYSKIKEFLGLTSSNERIRKWVGKGRRLGRYKDDLIKLPTRIDVELDFSSNKQAIELEKLRALRQEKLEARRAYLQSDEYKLKKAQREAIYGNAAEQREQTAYNRFVNNLRKKKEVETHSRIAWESFKNKQNLKSAEIRVLVEHELQDWNPPSFQDWKRQQKGSFDLEWDTVVDKDGIVRHIKKV